MTAADDDENSRRDAAGGERDDFECREIRALELIDLEVSPPRKVLDELGSAVDELLVLGRELLVDNCGESLPLGAGTPGVDV